MIYVGLQNAEKKYERNRHNAGAIVLTANLPVDSKFSLDKYTNSYKFQNFFLPSTFMNLSGESVAKILKTEHAESSELFVFFDDVTIPVGEYKISVGEGASSHNGIKSIIESLGGKNDFRRVRIGVGKTLEDGKLYVPSAEKLADFVLSNLNNLEIARIQGLSKTILDDISKLV